MTPIYCSKGHENTATNLYCQQCGEKLNATAGKGIYPGLLLGDRYRIVRQLGQGGFGRTYLVEDTNRFRELCVLKEFAPQVQGTYALQKASELFEREAGILYKLQHPQIPRFRELFRAKVDEEGHLFLVQEYVEGQTYRALLEARKRQGQRFTEAEVTQLMLQLLPVLEYIHSLGVIHRDISPDNMILRNADWLPVLIDFGGVKQVAATAQSQFTQATPDPDPPIATRLGKIGYAPNEQMQVGVAYPHSDLYALAATVLVLLTGKEPQQLIDPHNMTWNWRQEVSLSPTFAAILDKLLSYRPGDRYQSARQLMQVLGGTPATPNFPPTQPPAIPTPPFPTAAEATLAVSPAQRFANNNPATSPVTPVSSNTQPGLSSDSGILPKVAMIGIAVLIAGSIGWVVGSKVLPNVGKKPTDKPSVSPTKVVEPPPAPQFSKEERDRKAALQQRREELGINYGFYSALVNESFWQKNPSWRGKTLSNDPKDESLRKQWDEIGRDWLNKLGFLSPQYRNLLGSYGKDDLAKWKAQVNNLRLSTRALNDLADGEFFYRFPEQQRNNFINKPIGQIWYAIANSKVNAVQNGTALQRIVFPKGEIGDRVSGTLKPGEGKAYIAGLTEGQIMKVNLQADPKILFSVYPTTTDQKPLLQDSTKRSWSGKLPKSGFYEFIVVSKATNSQNYSISVSAETPAPPTPTPTATPTQSPTATPTATPTAIPTNLPTTPPTISPPLSPETPPSPETPTSPETPPSPETPEAPPASSSPSTSPSDADSSL